MELDSFDPIGLERADLNAASIRQAIGAAWKNPPDLEEATLHWDTEAWEERKRERLRAAFLGKDR